MKHCQTLLVTFSSLFLNSVMGQDLVEPTHQPNVEYQASERAIAVSQSQRLALVQMNQGRLAVIRLANGDTVTQSVGYSQKGRTSGIFSRDEDSFYTILEPEDLLLLPDSQDITSAAAEMVDVAMGFTTGSIIDEWSVETGEKIGSWTLKSNGVIDSMCLSHDGRHLYASVATTTGATLYTIDLESRDASQTLSLIEREVTKEDFRPRGHRSTIAGPDEEGRLFAISDDRISRVMPDSRRLEVLHKFAPSNQQPSYHAPARWVRYDRKADALYFEQFHSEDAATRAENEAAQLEEKRDRLEAQTEAGRLRQHNRRMDQLIRDIDRRIQEQNRPKPPPRESESDRLQKQIDALRQAFDAGQINVVDFERQMEGLLRNMTEVFEAQFPQQDLTPRITLYRSIWKLQKGDISKLIQREFTSVLNLDGISNKRHELLRAVVNSDRDEVLVAFDRKEEPETRAYSIPAGNQLRSYQFRVDAVVGANEKLLSGRQLLDLDENAMGSNATSRNSAIRRPRDFSNELLGGQAESLISRFDDVLLYRDRDQLIEILTGKSRPKRMAVTLEGVSAADEVVASRTASGGYMIAMRTGSTWKLSSWNTGRDNLYRIENSFRDVSLSSVAIDADRHAVAVLSRNGRLQIFGLSNNSIKLQLLLTAEINKLAVPVTDTSEHYGAFAGPVVRIADCNEGMVAGYCSIDMHSLFFQFDVRSGEIQAKSLVHGDVDMSSTLVKFLGTTCATEALCKRRRESVALGGRKVQRSVCGRSSWERGWRLATRC